MKKYLRLIDKDSAELINSKKMHFKHIFAIIFTVVFFLGALWFVNGDRLSAAYDQEDFTIAGELANNSCFPEQYEPPKFYLPENEYIKLPEKNSQIEQPEINSRAYFIFDPDLDYVFAASNTEEVLPIASLTKLVNALVFAGLNSDWDVIYEITEDDYVEGGRRNLFIGDKVGVNDLFNLALIASDNSAAMCLVKLSGKKESEYIELMNKKAWELGLAKTRFADPVGLSHQNVSTAREIAYLLKAAYAEKKIEQAIISPSYEFKTKQGREVKANNTNFLLKGSQSGIISAGGKTGYNEAAGYCFVGEFADNKKSVISVILGGDNVYSRITEAKKLAVWVFQNFTW
jgi:D-alanyl-D-alanine carboxypeptidase